MPGWCFLPLSVLFFFSFHPQAQFEGGPHLRVPFVSLGRLLTCISFHVVWLSEMKVLHKLCTGLRALITEKRTPSRDVRLVYNWLGRRVLRATVISARFTQSFELTPLSVFLFSIQMLHVNLPRQCSLVSPTLCCTLNVKTV